MLDLEGITPRLDHAERIYMWGLQCFGENPGPFRPALAGFGPDGDREGWHNFLAECESIVATYGDIPFVHWATYERVKIDLYISRYADNANGTAARVKSNLLDLLPIVRNSVAVPLSSYSLKDIETLTGYERQLTEYGGDWSMAKYIEATESEDEARREALMAEILDYNREDLEATWAVLEWLRGIGQR
jgi:predicted RecB family nuclease